MKKSTMGALFAGVVIVGGGIKVPSAAAADVNLLFTNWLPPFHHWTKTFRRFADSIEKQSGGKIKITVTSGKPTPKIFMIEVY